jgi:peptide subunit release factor 1 (eRF1)
VRDEGITQVIVSCDEVSLPLLREHLPKHLAEKVVDHIRVESHAAAADVLKASLEVMARVNTQEDREKVSAALDAYRAGGLGVVGPESTLAALINGQVDELLIAATLQKMHTGSLGVSAGSANDAAIQEPVLEPVSAGEPADASPEIVRLADELVSRAKQTGARLTFIEDADLLADYGGVAALLRFKI